MTREPVYTTPCHEPPTPLCPHPMGVREAERVPHFLPPSELLSESEVETLRGLAFAIRCMTEDRIDSRGIYAQLDNRTFEATLRARVDEYLVALPRRVVTR